MPSTPSVTVIVLTFNGKRHLEVCLPSLEALDYSNLVVMVADNGSSDGSVAWVRAHHPRVRVVEMGANLGFAAAYNRAVEQCDTDYIVLLNNDTRVAPSWLTELVSAAERNRAAAAASAILDWDGSRVDFVGGLPTFIGHSWQIDYGQPVGKAYAERPLLFGCGASVLVRRDAYLEAGGFDEDFFAYFEDVDLGWRMNLLGHTTVFAPEAVTYHRLHGTFGSLAHALRLRLYERNALAMICKNYGDEAMARVLPAAVALALARNLSHAGLDAGTFRFGVEAPEKSPLPAPLVAALIGLEDFAGALPALRRKREHIQAKRRVPDEEILRLFPEPLKLHEPGGRYRETAEALIRDFRIAELFGLPAPAAIVRSAVDRMRSAGASAPASESVRSAGASAAAEAPADRRSLGEGWSAPAAPADRVSVIVLTASGATHLPDCLDSLREHAWPSDRTEVIVVDNGSADDPTMVAERHYPGVKVIRTGRNLGFSAGNNAGARVATGQWLVFLNDDTRVAPRWLDELMDVARRRQAASVGALMVDWKGDRVDFAGGLANFEGRGYALHYDQAVSTVSPEETPILFGCGGAVLFRRDAFEGARGWDEPTFAYYEDVEFGWRLWTLGHEVWLAPRAIVHHKHHGTSGTLTAARARAFQRNSLRMIYMLLEMETLERALPAALLLAADRVLLGTPFSRANQGITEVARILRVGRHLSPALLKIRLLHALSKRGARRQAGLAANLRRVGGRGLAGAGLDVMREIRDNWIHAGARSHYLIEKMDRQVSIDGRVEWLPSATVAALRGIQDFLEMLPEASERRAWLQARRQRTDAEILSRFGGRWTAQVPSERSDLHRALREPLMEVLGIGR